MRNTLATAAALSVALALGGAAAAAGPDWSRWADLETVEIISTDEEGGSRLTTIWIVVLDGQAYIRTAGTTWGDNVEREGTLKIRGAPGEFVVRAEKVTDPALQETVVALFREKYGTTDAVMEFLRFGERRIFRLSG
jgi:hypothetical protein